MDTNTPLRDGWARRQKLASRAFHYFRAGRSVCRRNWSDPLGCVDRPYGIVCPDCRAIMEGKPTPANPAGDASMATDPPVRYWLYLEGEGEVGLRTNREHALPDVPAVYLAEDVDKIIAELRKDVAYHHDCRPYRRQA